MSAVPGTVEIRDTVAIVWVDNPPVNAISSLVREHLVRSICELESNPSIHAMVIACKGKTFMAGADITEFSKPYVVNRDADMIGTLHGCTKPVVAALHGTAFGGGFEVAMACDYRVATASARVGLPEVKLGLLPGGGGTQSLPRLIGVKDALRLMLSGDAIGAQEACKLGAIDRVVDGDLLDAAVEFARSKMNVGRRRVVDIRIEPSATHASLLQDARATAQKSKTGRHAPTQIVDCVQAAIELPFAEGRKVERERFLACRQHPESKALRHVFFAERRTRKIPDLTEDGLARSVKVAAVIGAGTMGGGIAMCLADASIPVHLLETSQETLYRGLAVIRKNYEATAAKGRLSRAQVEARMNLILPTVSYDDLADADFIIEAAFETLEIKKDIFQKLDKVAKSGAVLASNTSRLSIDSIGEATARPQDVVGTHFFSPANVMRLCEVVRGSTATSPSTLATSLELARRIGKVGVVSGNCYGFIGNRMLSGYTGQALSMVVEGALPEQVDGALRRFGMPMGPFQMSDLAGLDVGYRSRKGRTLTSREQRDYRLADKLVEMGRCGQKTGGGYYDYAEGTRTPSPSAIVSELIDDVAREHKVTRRVVSDEEIVERCIFALVNIGCEVLREEMAYRASDIDIVYLNGYGFPSYRGGPMFWAEQVIGLPTVLERVRNYHALTADPVFDASPLLIRLASETKGFDSLEVVSS